MDGQATGIVNSAASPHGWTLVQSEARRQPVSRDAWLWQNDELSDGTLFLVRKAPPSFNACTEASIDEQELPMKRVCMLRGCCAQRLQQVTAGFAPRPPDYVSRFKVHKTVYSAASGFFKACFAANGTPSMAGHGWPVWCDECMVSTLTMSDPELEVAEHVFKFMYTLKLPTGASGGLVELDGMQLVWMIQVAEYLDIPACIKACAESLCTLSCDFFPVSAVLSMPATLHMHPTIPVLVAKALEHLFRIFGDVPSVMRDRGKCTRLLQLSSAELLTLLCSPSLTTDSESSVVMMTAAWYTANRQSCSNEHFNELRSQLRLSRLPVEFICRVLQKLPDFRLGRDQLTKLWMAASPRGPVDPADLEPLWAGFPASFFFPERPSCGEPFRLRLKVQKSKLLEHAAAVSMMQVRGPAPKEIKSGKVFGFGYNWELILSSSCVDEALALRLVLCSAMDLELDVMMECSLRVDSPKALVCKPRNLLSSTTTCAWLDVLGNADRVLSGDDSIWPWKKFLVDGCLCFEVQIWV